MLDSSLRLASAITLLAAAVVSQCTPDWLAANSYPGTNGLVRAITRWDPDGPGPLSERIAVGGYFSAAGASLTANVASFDPATAEWTPIGAGLPGTQGSHVYALLALSSGALLAGGDMPVGMALSPGVAIWTGGSWQQLGYPGGQGIYLGTWGAALALSANGDVLAAGEGGVARWNGASWQVFGATLAPAQYGPSDGYIRALAVLPNGDLVAAGAFWSIGSVSAFHVARWDGTTWHAMGSGLPGPVGSVSVLANGDVVATGLSSGTFGVARWNGSTWTSLGGGFNADVLASAVLTNGDLVVGGGFSFPGIRIARWDGTTWQAMGFGADNTVVALLALPGAELIAGGRFRKMDGNGRRYVARWNGSWSALGAGVDDQVRDFDVMPNGDVVIGGDFTHAGTVDARRVARWSGGTWQALGTGIAGAGVPNVRAVEVLANGDVVAGGTFDTAGGVPAQHLARFDGAQWHAMGTSAGPGTVHTLLELPNGELLVGGYFRINGAVTWLARWSPSGWTTLPAAPNSEVHSAILLRNGELLIGGLFTMVGSTPASGIARGNGTTWSALGAGLAGSLSSVPCLAEMPNGVIVVAGSFATAGGAPIPVIAQWNGAQWAPLGSQPFAQVRAFARLPNGDLAVGGAFEAWLPPGHIARWNGSSWSVLGAAQGSVTGGSVFTPTIVQSLAMLTSGDLAVSGPFLGGGAATSPYLALLAPTCRAAVVSNGSGCAGSGGNNVLEALTLPWAGSTFRSRGTGMPALALVAHVIGFSTVSLPLSLLLPQGQPGCDLLVAPDLLDFVLPGAGAVDVQIALPNTTAIIGQVVHQQLIPFEVDSLPSIVAITATNALQLTFGWF